MGQKRAIPSSVGGAGAHLISSAAMTGTSTILSPTFDAKFLDNIGIQLKWTGTPTGTFTILASINNVDFYSLTFSPAITQPSGSAGGYLINLNEVPFPYLQVQYVNSTGTGVLDAWFSAKDLN